MTEGSEGLRMTRGDFFNNPRLHGLPADLSAGYWYLPADRHLAARGQVAS